MFTVLFSAACGSSPAQSAPSYQAINKQNANNVCRIYFTKPKPGMASQFEEARKKHMQFHKSQSDTWTWNTWEIATGDNTGTYVTSTCGHAWKDFDDWEKKMGKADAADATAGMGPLEERSSNAFYVYRSDMSLRPANGAPAAMESVAIYVLRPGMGPDFVDGINKITAALAKQPDWPKTSGWLQLANGGEGPTFVSLGGRQSWADYTPLSKSVVEVATEAYGKESADALFKSLRDCEAHVATETAIYRPDLSYLPK